VLTCREENINHDKKLFFKYNKLKLNSFCTLSDNRILPEELTTLVFPRSINKDLYK